MADGPLIERVDRIVERVLAREDATAALSDAEVAPLARIAADLRHCPRRDFTSRLRAQLGWRTRMRTALVAPNIREGFTSVTPYVWVPDRGLTDFLVRVFDAIETNVADNPGHGTHRELRIGDSMLMIGEHDRSRRRPAAFHVFVDDADAVFARAVAAGGISLGVPEDQPYGERTGFVRDPYGNEWYIATALGPSSLAQATGTVTPFVHVPDASALMEFLSRAFGAQEESRVEHGGQIRYARMRVGTAAIELNDAHAGSEPMLGTFFLYVGDPDAVYEQALAVGAKSLAPPADRPSGDRIGFVEDPAGNHWYIARPS